MLYLTNTKTSLPKAMEAMEGFSKSELMKINKGRIAEDWTYSDEKQ